MPWCLEVPVEAGPVRRLTRNGLKRCRPLGYSNVGLCCNSDLELGLWVILLKALELQQRYFVVMIDAGCCGLLLLLVLSPTLFKNYFKYPCYKHYLIFVAFKWVKDSTSL